jgi:predicted lactoylglutathione lyase
MFPARGHITFDLLNKQLNLKTMATKIFVNLPVKNLGRSMQFFTSVGFSFNPQFTGETSACMVISESIFVMLEEASRFKEYTQKPISDATRSTEMILALDAESRSEVDATVERAVNAGGLATNKRDHGFMYASGFQDPDGHLWELLWMDMSAMPQE